MVRIVLLLLIGLASGCAVGVDVRDRVAVDETPDRSMLDKIQEVELNPVREGWTPPLYEWGQVRALIAGWPPPMEVSRGGTRELSGGSSGDARQARQAWQSRGDSAFIWYYSGPYTFVAPRIFSYGHTGHGSLGRYHYRGHGHGRSSSNIRLYTDPKGRVYRRFGERTIIRIK